MTSGRLAATQAELYINAVTDTARAAAQVTAVQVTAFINNTYHSLVQYESRAPGAPLVAVDSRPSDAINLALRFGAPVYVHKKARCPPALPVPLHLVTAVTRQSGIVSA